MYTALFSILFLIVGGVVGWVGCERYLEYLAHERHDFEELFQENPHPEIFDSNGNIYRGDYTTITFEPGYNPDEFDPEDILGPEEM